MRADQFPMEVRLECLNSVDGSTRFRAEVGWFRLVCSNGLQRLSVVQAEADRRHIGNLQEQIEWRTQIPVLTVALED